MEKTVRLNALAQLLCRRIERGGPISLAEYMTLSLSHREHGYYQHRDPFGTSGDFITAPEISQVFGELLGGWCAVLWEAMGSPPTLRLIEAGPGRGTLMQDALRVACRNPGFRKALRLHLVETSAALRDIQARALVAFQPVFHDHLDDVPEGPTLLLANEFFDALPIRQYERTVDGWRERLVTVSPVTVSPSPGGFCFTLADTVTPPQQIPAQIRNAPTGSIVEISLPALSLAHGLGERVCRLGGAALVLDYGSPVTKSGESFQSVRGHHFHDPFANPGEADLTAHVDFQSLGEAARASGAHVPACLPQGVFLERLGIGPRAKQLAQSADPATAAAIHAACHRLIDPKEMGTLFQVLAIAHPDLVAIAGFDAASDSDAKG
ncbi:SAM-dependent methyltransferase [Rhodospirillaceae bacterium AH-315-P19]|nr:SAM-dependent methyltransferase [Rhodospirillaceae bacterium AH-315-P19]